MPCYHPRKGFIIGYTLDNKKIIKITSYNIDHLEKYDNEWNQIENKDIVYPKSTKVIRDFVDIPCGKCIGCRLDYARNWSCRLLCELESQPEGAQSWFITLTYDDDHIPITHAPDDVDCYPQFTLCKKDIQAFIKRLRNRKECKDYKIRFFVAGEYGTTSYRPHYHLILFNCPISDAKPVKVVNGQIYYHSDWLDSVWENGYCMIGKVTAETCSYTAQYCVKKAFGIVNSTYDELGIEREFTNMSRKPGIGYNWLEKHSNILSSPVINLSTENGGKKFDIPRYFMVKLEKMELPSTEFNKNKNFVELLKEHKHKYVLDKRALEDNQSTKTYLERLADSERVRIKNIKKEREVPNEKA